MSYRFMRRATSRGTVPSRRALTSLVTALVTFGLLLSPGAPHFVVVRASSVGPIDATEQLATYFDTIAALRADLDRTEFDVGDLALALAFEEASTIVEWVQDNLAYEQYVGLLRGPQGTLMSKAGNALDQAVLLAAVLNGAGYDARVAEGTLSTFDAERLLKTMRPARPRTSAVSSLSATSIESLANVSGAPRAEIHAAVEEALVHRELADTTLFARSSVVADALGSALVREGEIWDERQPDALVAEARNYHWVQYRLASDRAWIDAHPLFGRFGSSPGAVEVDRSFEHVVPAELQHRVRFEAFIAQRLGETIRVQPLMSAWEQPVALVYGRPIPYSNSADSLASLAAFEDVGDALSRASLFFPVLDGAVPAGGMAFNLEGSIVVPEAAQSAAAGVFRELGRGFGEAAGGVAGADPESFVELAAHWIEYTLIEPDGRETRHIRHVLRQPTAGDNDGDTRLSTIDIARSLTAQHTFMVVSGRLAPSFVADQYFAKILSLRPVVESMIAQSIAATSRPLADFDAARFAEVDDRWFGHYLIVEAFDRFGDALTDRIVYRAEPTLITYRQDISVGDVHRASVDIISNARRVFDVSLGEPVADPEAALRLGVWETFAEALAFDESADPVGAASVFFDAVTAGVGLTVLRDLSDVGRVMFDLNVDGDVVEEMEVAIRHGYAVIVPSSRDFDRDGPAWFRVDTRTGATLGVVRGGLGGAVLEYLVVGGFVAMFVLVACSLVANAHTPREKLPCLQLGIIVGGIAGGLAVAAYGGVIFGVIALALWSLSKILDIYSPMTDLSPALRVQVVSEHVRRAVTAA